MPTCTVPGAVVRTVMGNAAGRRVASSTTSPLNVYVSTAVCGQEQRPVQLE